MCESKYSRASSESFSLSAEASFARLSNGVCSAASRTPAAKTASGTEHLSAVIRIDMDIVFGQIARPERRASLPLAGDPEHDRDIGIVEPHLHIGFIERSGEPAAANLHVLQRDIDLRGIEID